MNPDVVTIRPDQTATAAWRRMQRERIRHLVVSEDSRLLGVLSERDLGGRNGAAVRRGQRVKDLMTPEVASASPGTTLRQAANLMRGRMIGSLPVVDDARIVGIVTATDVLDELGRGSTRPEVRAQRQGMRLPPASARRMPDTDPSAGAPSTRRAAGGMGRGKKAGKGVRKAATDAAVSISGRITPSLGRKRERRPDSVQRAPLPGQVSRPDKRRAGRTSAPEVPAHIRAIGVPLDAPDRDYLRRKLGRKLGKFAPSIERTSVRIEDVNGPRGGIDKSCRVKVVLSGLPSVVVEERHHSLQAAMDGALQRVEYAVRQRVRRRRTKQVR